MPKPKVLSRFLAYISAAILLLAGLDCRGQGFDVRDEVVRKVFASDRLSEHVAFLTDTLCAGRGSGTRGAAEAAFWISRRFESLRLCPFGEYVHSSRAGERTIHNVLGLSPAANPDAGYVIVAAHYDNLGVLNGRMYPGADSNASGVAVMLLFANAVRSLSVLGSVGGANVIFAALDAKQLSMAGASALCDEIASGRLTDPLTGRRIGIKDIKAFVNLDILGSTLEPVHSGREDYLIMLSTDKEMQSTVTRANYRSKCYMDVAFDYYGSRDFTDLFLRRIGDQKPFIEAGVPSVLFTSGITKHTNKTSDTLDTLDIQVLEKRSRVIFCWLEDLLSR